MRWFTGLIVLASGIGIGLLLARIPMNDSSEVQSRSEPGPSPAPVVISVDALLAASRFEVLAERLQPDLDVYRAVVEPLPAPQRVTAFRAWRDVAGPGIEVSRLQARALVDASRPVEAARLLIDAAVEVSSRAQQEEFERSLAQAVEAAARTLVAAGQTGELDGLFEEITFSLPELAEYFLKLGTLRVQTGDDDGALAVLSQIQNHPAYGPPARALLEDVQSGTVSRVNMAIETLSLRRRGDQFIVDATLDDRGRVALLIDTGASMTVISRDRLEGLGYTVDGPTAWFSTAGGVVEGPVMTLSRLALGKAEVRQLPVGVLPLAFPGGIDGLLGMNFLRHFEFRIDQDGAELRLDAPSR